MFVTFITIATITSLVVTSSEYCDETTTELGRRKVSHNNVFKTYLDCDENSTSQDVVTISLFLVMGDGNLTHKWYVDGMACMKFNHRVPTIKLYDAGRSMTRNSRDFVILLDRTTRLIEPKVMVASPKSSTNRLGPS